MARKINTLTVSIFILLIAALLISGINHSRASFLNESTTPEFMHKIDDWQFEKQIPLSEDIFNYLGTRGAGLAQYANSAGDRIWIYILKSKGRRASIHQPEYCYIGSGHNELLNRGTIGIVNTEGKKENANYIFTQNEKGFQIVLYFYTVNDIITNNYYKQQLFFLLKKLKREDVEASLVRISKFSKTNDFSQDLLVLQHIANKYVASIKSVK